jgi:HEPN domain-containing protein
MNSPLELARSLWIRANGDRYILDRLASDSAAPAWVLGFHAQQAVEKTLKAILALNRIEYPRTHNLSMLLELLRRHALPLPPDGNELALLIPFGVALRYDDLPDDESLVLDRAWAVRVVSNTLNWAEVQFSDGG